MKKIKTRIIIVLCIVIALGGIGFGVIRTAVISQREAAAIMEQEMEREREIKLAYTQINRAFNLRASLSAGFSRIDIEVDGEYRPFPETDPERNRFGIMVELYWILLMYEIRTGNVLAYETVVEYFSQEYEPDGSLRLHNNGNHPEINAFVEWMWEGNRWLDYEEFIGILIAVFHDYYRENQDNEYVPPPLETFSPQMLREFARVVADPDVTAADIDLTSLQKAGD